MLAVGGTSAARLVAASPALASLPTTRGFRDLRGITCVAVRLFLRPAPSLVEKIDTELFSDFSAKSSNFRRLVLSCINADFCVQILILQRFSRSTRLPHLCTARSSKSSQIFVKLFHIFAEISAKIAIFQQFSSNFAPISMKIFQNFAE